MISTMFIQNFDLRLISQPQRRSLTKVGQKQGHGSSLFSLGNEGCVNDVHLVHLPLEAELWNRKSMYKI